VTRFFGLSSTKRIISSVALTALLVASCSLTLFGQNLATAASLSGVITDPQGARIASATVTIANTGRGLTRTFTTDSSGTFSFTLLPPAVYELSVQAAGFLKFVQGEITLEVGQAGTLNVSLRIGNTQENVQVTGEAPLLQTDSANIATQISEKQIQDLPLNFRNPVFLAFLDSSVKNIDEGYMGAGLDNNDQASAFMSFGGQFFGSTAFLLDGSWDTELGSSLISFVPSVDEVQEFKVQTNSFTAQYALSNGNSVNFITKSGTSRFHGNVFEFMRNSALDANYYFNNYHDLPKTLLHLNQFGASGGGPLYFPGISKRKDRTFFFALYEGYRSSGTSANSLTAPTAAFKSGDLSALLGAQIGTDALCRPIVAGQIYNPQAYQTTAACGSQAGQTVFIRDPIPGNNLSGMIDPVAKNFLPYFPAPTSSNPFNNFYRAQAVPISSDEMSIRIDHNITDNARLYGRFSRKWQNQTEIGDLYGASDAGGPGQSLPNRRFSVALGYNQVFSPTLTASVNLGFQRWVSFTSGQGYPFHPSTLGLPAELDTISPIFPAINFSSLAGGNQGEALTSAYTPLGSPGSGRTPTGIGTISTDITKVFRTHTLSFGYMGTIQLLNLLSVSKTAFDFTQAFTSGPDPTNPTPGTGDPFASFLLGNPAGGSTGVIVSPAERKINHGWYLQDEWKTTRKLTLNLGVRYDIQGAPTELYNRQAYFVPTAVNPISALVGGTYHGELVYNNPNNRGNFQVNYNNFSPRFGFAYELTQKLVARGGYGIFYSPNFFGETPLGSTGASNVGYSQATSYVASLNGGINPASTFSNPFPNGILAPIGNSEGGLTEVGQNIPATDVYARKSQYVQQWSLGFQYSPTRNDVIEASYIGNHALHVLVGNYTNLNELPPNDLALGQAALVAPVSNPFFGQSAMAGSSCGLDQSTVPAFQLMLPMPQYCDSVLSFAPPLGFSFYDALELKYTHRSGNLTFLTTYTNSKWLDNAEAMSAFDQIFMTSVTRNYYNLNAEKSVDLYDVPNAAVVSFVYALPVGKGKRIGSNFNSFVNGVLGGWQLSAINTFKNGSPIAISADINGASLFGGNQHAEVIGDPNQPGNFAANPACVGPTKIHTVEAWFNPCAFVAAPAGSFGNAPRYFSNLRAPGYAFTDFAVEKFFNMTERFRGQFRVELFNALNHPILGEPYPFLGSGTFGTIGYADVSRQIQVALKIYW
jgi:hypothetical protein